MTEPTNSELANKLESMAKRRDENDEHQILGWVSDVYRLAAQRLRQAEADAEDAARLLFVVDMMDGIGDIDFHEEASVNANAFGREEPNDDDYIAAVRTAIDAARKEQP